MIQFVILAAFAKIPLTKVNQVNIKNAMTAVQYHGIDQSNPRQMD
jgi:hypothetical protein